MGKTKNNVRKFSHCGFAGKVSEKNCRGEIVGLVVKDIIYFTLPM